MAQINISTNDSQTQRTDLRFPRGRGRGMGGPSVGLANVNYIDRELYSISCDKS